MENFKFDLQIFADAGTVVNATGGYVNSGTGEVTGFTDGKTLSPELKAFYDTELLENARTEMFYAQFAKRQPLPANHHGSVEWRKWNTFDRAAKLKEGVIPTGQKFGVTTVTGAVDQYGTYTSITDKLELRAYDDVILGATEEMGASAAETQEKLIRDALLMGTNVLYCDNIDKDSGKVLSTPESCAQMGAGGVTKGASGAADTPHGWSLLTPAMINKAVTIMKKNRVPRINGYYYAVIHPSVAHDLRQDEGWIEAHKYAAPDAADTPHGWSLLTPAMINKAVTIMKKNRVPRINGYYYAVIHPSVAHDLRQDEGWIEAHKYAAPDALFNGEIGELHGVRFIENVFAPVLGVAGESADGDDEYVNKSRSRTYATYFFGKDSFGIIDPEGGALEMIVHDKGEIGGPLNQFSTIGYKFETNGATILYPERLLRVMSCSSFSASDEVN